MRPSFRPVLVYGYRVEDLDRELANQLLDKVSLQPGPEHKFVAIKNMCGADIVGIHLKTGLRGGFVDVTFDQMEDVQDRFFNHRIEIIIKEQIPSEKLIDEQPSFQLGLNTWGKDQEGGQEEVKV